MMGCTCSSLRYGAASTISARLRQRIRSDRSFGRIVVAATFVAVVLLPSRVEAQSQFELGIFAGPPVPLSMRPYSIRVFGAIVGTGITVDGVVAATNEDNVDVTFFITRATSNFFPAAYQGTVAGPLLPTGVYTFRQFTRGRFPDQAEYSPPVLAYTRTVIVTSPRSVGDAIEYYHPQFDHYFVTALPAEMDILDSGVIAGWARTGQTLGGVYLADPSTGAALAPLAPVCRLYGIPGAGQDTHFFSASPAECARVIATWPNQWVLEANDAFRVSVPHPADGNCPDATVPVYRLYNNRPDANHRYTTSKSIRQQMIDQSWIPEGYGTLGVAMCVNAV